jgi:hydrogenase maturation protease
MSHALGPAAVLALTAALYGRAPEAWVLAVRGHSFALGEGLTERSERDLGLALEFLEAFLKGERP